MRYHYFYQTKDNKSLDDWIAARDRSDAYAQLRKRGIKPYRLDGRNPLAWKRWTAIAILSIALVSISIFSYFHISTLSHYASVAEERSQLYGDPATLQTLSANGWRDTFPDEGDAFLARHAVPGVACGCGDALEPLTFSTRPAPVTPEDPPELAKMKRMVNCMKREFADYIAGDGTAEDYAALCCQRQRTERDIVLDTDRDFEKLRRRLSDPEDADAAAQDWQRKNDLLRSMGLPTVVMPLDPNG